MKKALDQTVRDLKREVNKKVLKVPSIEQKTLDATSNEPWGPRGSLMAEIAQASCNYNDYQLIMAVLWKRIQDTGKNWRHVYKALSVLEYLVIYGAERVIDDTREHAYQISTLSDFLYTDSNGRDQGSNVRRKSQTLVALLNNKEKLQEVRHKALSNKEKVSRPPLSSSARYNDEHFEGGNMEDGIGRERDLALRDKDRYHIGGDKYSKGRDQYVKDNDEFYSRDDSYKVHANGNYQYRPKSHSVDGYTNNSFDDYDRHSTRSDGSRDGEILHNERIDAPPSYEAATNDSWSDVPNDKGAAISSMQKAYSPARPKEASSRGTNQASGSVAGESAQANEKEVASFDEFDPRGSVPAAPTVASGGLELDIFGLSSVDYTDSSASMLVTSTAIPDDDVLTNSGLGANFVMASTAHAVSSEPDENPFGDAPFKAISQENFQSETNASASSATSQASFGFVSFAETNLPVEKMMEAAQSHDFGNTLGGSIYAPNVADAQHSLTNPTFYASENSSANSSKDILEGILPWIGPAFSVPFHETQPPAQSHLPQLGFSASSTSHANNSSQTGSPNFQIGQLNPFEPPEQSNHLSGQANPFEFQAFQQTPSIEIDANQMNYQGFQVNPSQQQNLSFQAIPLSSKVFSHMPQVNNTDLTGLLAPVHSTVPVNGFVESAQLNPLQPLTVSAPLSSSGNPVSSQTFRLSAPTIIQSPQINLQPFRPVASTIFQEAQKSLKNIPVSSQPAEQATNTHLPDPIIYSQGSVKPQPPKKKFEPKSAVWADSISRGLVDLNISGPKINPLADIGVDFDDINRKEKRNEAKGSQAPLPSSFAMGKAMGAGSGLGRADAGAGAGTGAFIQPLNPTMGSNMGMGMGGNMGMGMDMNMGMRQQSSGMPQLGPGFPGAYNTMNARGGYGHQPYGHGGHS